MHEDQSKFGLACFDATNNIEHMTKRQTPRQAPPIDLIGNKLLKRLRFEDYELLRPHLEGWIGERGDVLYEAGHYINYVYFPCHEALISIRIVLPDGRTVESGLIGREGVIGGIASNGSLATYARCVIQFPGLFYRIPLEQLDRIKASSKGVRNLFSRYAECLLSQILQSAACNATHSIEQRSAKWLVSALVRTQADRVPLTQEQLGDLLGVGRSYVARVLARFRADNIIATRRGHLIIRDQDRLSKASCQCDRSVMNYYASVLDGIYAEAGPEVAPTGANLPHTPQKYSAVEVRC